MEKPKVSLQFSKTLPKRSLQKSALCDVASGIKDKVDKEVVQSIENNIIEKDEKKEEAQLVIPLPSAHRHSAVQKALARKALASGGAQSVSFGESQTLKENEQKKVQTLDKLAEAEILKETKQGTISWKNDDKNLSIASVTGDTEADSTSVAKESTLDDYTQISVGNYGAALLRGMGWKKSEGIGKSRKMIDIVEASARSFGMSKKQQQHADVDEQDEELHMKVGACVFIHSGHNKGIYGKIEFMDIDHLMLRLSNESTIVRDVELNVKVVANEEYKSMSRVINKEMYDKYKAKEKKKQELQKINSTSEQDCKSDALEVLEDQQARETEKHDKELHKKILELKFKKKNIQDELSVDELHTQQELSQVKSEDMGGHFQDCGDTSKRKHGYHSSSEDESLLRIDRDRKKEYSRDRREHDRDRRKHDGSKRREYDGDRERKHDSYREDSCRTENARDRTMHKMLEDKSTKSDSHRNREDERSKRKDKRQKADENKKLNDQSIFGSLQSDDVSRFSGCSTKIAKSDSQATPVIPWIQENLKVRLISKTYKGGKYHKAKMIVRSVDTVESCDCKIESGKILKGISPEWLETVIPKVPPYTVLVVHGKFRGQKGQILKLHKEEEKASLQLLRDRSVIIKLHYNDICEYVS